MISILNSNEREDYSKVKCFICNRMNLIGKIYIYILYQKKEYINVKIVMDFTFVNVVMNSKKMILKHIWQQLIKLIIK